MKRELEEFDAIFFDNDGVLVDTEPLFLRATQEIFATVDVPLADADYYEISMRAGRSAFELLAARGYEANEIEELRAQRNLRYSELIDEGIVVLDGVAESVESLHESIPMAVVTSSSRHHFDRIHRQTDLLRYFDFVLANGDYDKHKPHPEPYLTAAERLSVDPARCLAIEDTERGLHSAAAAGMSCIVIPNALTAHGDFGAAHRVLDSMNELIPFLGLAPDPK